MSSSGTFWDTVVICALTGIVIVSSVLAYPDITFEADVKPSFIDKLLHRMNPRHIVNEEIVIYRNNPVRKDK